MRALTDEDVQKLLAIEDVIGVVEEGFRLYSLGKTVTPHRMKVSVDYAGGDILIMPCLSADLNIFSTKIVTVYPQNLSKGMPTIHAILVAINPENGAPHLICDAKALTGLRTGAATAISIKYLARKDSKVLGIIGCGYQAKWQLLAATKMLNFEEIKIYDIDREKMLNFKQNFKEVFDDRIKLMSSVDDLVNSSDVIITATTSRYPFVKKKQVKPGTHISAIGAYTPDMAEIEAELIAVSKLVVDSREAALSEAGDIIQAIKKGYITKDYIYAEIGEIIAGMKQGRANMDEITIFKSVGLSIQDAAAASLLLRKFRNLYS
ncbi:MAG: ornithine cyclodeaminase family protein [Nitrososphaerota archaeon]